MDDRQWYALSVKGKADLFAPLYDALPKPVVVCRDTSFLGIHIAGFTEVRLSNNTILKRSHTGCLADDEVTDWANCNRVPSPSDIFDESNLSDASDDPAIQELCTAFANTHLYVDEIDEMDARGNDTESRDTHDGCNEGSEDPDMDECVWVGPSDLDAAFSSKGFALPTWLLEECGWVM